MSGQVVLQSMTTHGRSVAPSNNDAQADSNYGSLEEVDTEPNTRQVEITNNVDTETDTCSPTYDSDDDQEIDSKYGKFVNNIQKQIGCFFADIKQLVMIFLVLLYFLYFGYAMYFRFGDEGSIRLLVGTVLAGIGIVCKLINIICPISGSPACFQSPRFLKLSKWFGYFLQIVIAILAIVYIVIDIALDTPENLISLAGLVVFVFLFYIFSVNPARVKLRPVFWGLALQFIFALLILRWKYGYQIFKWLGDRVTEFLAYAIVGAKFMFGDLYYEHYFAFAVLPMVVLFSTITTVLYYLGVMQFIIKYVARFIAMALGTSAPESLNVAANIFIGMTETPLLIRPFLPDMTKSELHAVMTGGFATVAGPALAAYIMFKVPANHLITASIMSAPAALAMAKLSYPETKRSKFSDDEVYNNLPKGTERNILEAASAGATQALTVIGNISVNLIAFISLLEFVNATLKWFGYRVGLEAPHYEELTFQFICSYVFWPVAHLMGVASSDCRRIGALIGVKTFVNEMVAYKNLGVYIENRRNLTWYESLVNTTNNISGVEYTGDWSFQNGDIQYTDMNITLVGGILQERSVVIATYALCGFSNMASTGIMIGVLGGLAPTRKRDVSEVVFRAMVAGNVACFMTACIAGLFYKGDLT